MGRVGGRELAGVRGAARLGAAAAGWELVSRVGQTRFVVGRRRDLGSADGRLEASRRDLGDEHGRLEAGQRGLGDEFGGLDAERWGLGTGSGRDAHCLGQVAAEGG
jgi:hypothetical protein